MKYKVGDKVEIIENIFYYNRCLQGEQGEISNINKGLYGINITLPDNHFFTMYTAEQNIKLVKSYIFTNRQWLESLSDEEFVDWLMNDYEQLKYQFTSTRSGMIKWLKDEHKIK